MLTVVILSAVVLNANMQNVMIPSHYAGFHVKGIKLCKKSYPLLDGQGTLTDWEGSVWLPSLS